MSFFKKVPVPPGLTYGVMLRYLEEFDRLGLADYLFPAEMQCANGTTRFHRSIELLRTMPPDEVMDHEVIDALLDQVDDEMPPEEPWS